MLSFTQSAILNKLRSSDVDVAIRNTDVMFVYKA